MGNFIKFEFNLDTVGTKSTLLFLSSGNLEIALFDLLQKHSEQLALY